MKYPTYQAAKVANPDQEIYELSGKFQTGDTPARPGDKWELCNPADYCMTVKQFLDAGHKGVNGDLYLNKLGELQEIGVNGGEDWFNEPSPHDDKRFVIKAKVLEEAKTYRYEKVTDSIFDLKEEFERGELYFLPLSYNGLNQKDYEVIETSQMAGLMHKEDRIYRRIEVTERELELEAAYDLYCIYCKVVDWPITPISEFKERDPDRDGMLAIVRKTGYRKDFNTVNGKG